MAGVNITLDAQTASVGSLLNRITQRTALFAEINEYLLQSTRERFLTQVAPDGSRWAPLSPRYQKRKHKNANRILTLRGHLQSTLRGQFTNDELLFGSDRPYAALMQLGGTIQRQSRKATVYFKQHRDGSIGNRFSKKKSSNFAQDVNIGAHTATHIARPFLGLSAADLNQLNNIVMRHLSKE